MWCNLLLTNINRYFSGFKYGKYFSLKNTKLYDYLCRLSVYELNRFRKYMYSPYYNDDDRLKKVTDVLLPYAKTRTLDEVDELFLWSKVNGKAPFNTGKYTRLLSDTVKKVEHFLVTDRFNQKQILQHTYQLQIMNERNLHKHTAEFLRLTEKHHMAQPRRDGAFYYHHLLIQEQKNIYLENYDRRSADKNLQGVMDSLDVYYVLGKLKYGAALLHYQNFLAIETDVVLLKEALQLSMQEQFDVPAIQIYRHIVLSITEPGNEAHYRELKNLLTRHSTLFATDELKTLFVFAINYCINRINLGQSAYLKELLSLYQFALKNDLLLEDGVLSPWEFKNMVTVGLRVKELRWTEKFIEEYKHKLPKEEKQNAYTFNIARLHFYKKNYDRVLQLLQDVKYSDIFYQLDSKTTLLKTYYETGEELPLLSLKDSFRVMLARKRLITPQQRANYNNLLMFAIKLFRMDVKNKKGLATLRHQIEGTANIADKSWLLEKLAELEG